MTDRTIDPRARRSRERLHAALVAAILERGWERVSVREVCARAGVGRSTFYAHFADKEDLLVGGLDLVRDAVRAARKGKAVRPFGFVPALIAHADGSRRMVRAVIGKRSGLAVQRRFRQVVLALIEDELPGFGVTSGEAPAIARFLTGALVELLTWWVDERAAMSADGVAATFARLAAAVIRDSEARVSGKRGRAVGEAMRRR